MCIVHGQYAARRFSEDGSSIADAQMGYAERTWISEMHVRYAHEGNAHSICISDMQILYAYQMDTIPEYSIVIRRNPLHFGP